MSKRGRFWDWLLPELICLCPMGALAYYTASAEHAAQEQNAARTRWLDLGFEPLTGTAAVSVARS